MYLISSYIYIIIYTSNILIYFFVLYDTIKGTKWRMHGARFVKNILVQDKK